MMGDRPIHIYDLTQGRVYDTFYPEKGPIKITEDKRIGEWNIGF